LLASGDCNIIDAVQKSREQSERRSLLEVPAVKVMAGTLVFLASAGFFGFVALNVAIKHGEKVTVPNVVNMDVVEALDALSKYGLEMRKTGARNSSSIPEDYVVSQEPRSGSVVKEGTAVSVVISMGSKTAEVPNLVGKSLREARVDLTTAGLRVGRFSRIYNASERETVLAQSPPSKQQVPRETPVSMLVSLGHRPREYKTPNFVGLSLEKASALLKSMNVSLGKIQRKTDHSRPQGVILEQSPAPGSFIAEGSSVSLVANALSGQRYRMERKFGVFLYKVPYGFRPKAVRVDLSDTDGKRTIHEGVSEAGSSVAVGFAYSGNCTVKVYVDGVLEAERIFR